MYEIDLSTIMLIGIDDEKTKVVTLENEFKINSTIEQYNSLKEEVKLLITNYNKLLSRRIWKDF